MPAQEHISCAATAMAFPLVVQQHTSYLDPKEAALRRDTFFGGPLVGMVSLVSIWVV